VTRETKHNKLWLVSSKIALPDTSAKSTGYNRA
jgi:hypothetical protein